MRGYGSYYRLPGSGIAPRVKPSLRGIRGQSPCGCSGLGTVRSTTSSAPVDQPQWWAIWSSARTWLGWFWGLRVAAQQLNGPSVLITDQYGNLLEAGFDTSDLIVG